MIRKAIPYAIAGLLGLGATQAQAHNCVGFGDLAGESPFCPSVSWLKNREITAGCGTNVYCPDAVVTRLQMAAFLQRMGDKLAPTLLSAAEARPAGSPSPTKASSRRRCPPATRCRTRVAST